MISQPILIYCESFGRTASFARTFKFIWGIFVFGFDFGGLFLFLCLFLFNDNLRDFPENDGRFLTVPVGGDGLIIAEVTVVLVIGKTVVPCSFNDSSVGKMFSSNGIILGEFLPIDVVFFVNCILDNIEPRSSKLRRWYRVTASELIVVGDRGGR